MKRVLFFMIILTLVLCAGCSKPKKAQVGDIITFGTYEQDNKESNGKEPIEWLVLAVEDGRALVISRYGLDRIRYNEEQTEVTWETCSIREWLNGEFFTGAFSKKEQQRIAQVTVRTGETDTTDRIFLLSINEAEQYFTSDWDRKCKVTAYAEAKGAVEDLGYGIWWLRSPAIYRRDAAKVTYLGEIDKIGSTVSWPNYVVRPAMWLNR